MARILVIGSVAGDEVVKLTEPLRAGTHLNGVVVDVRLGGGGANTAVALTAAGHEVILLAAVGQDALGDTLVAELAATGIDTTFISRLAQPTTHSILLIDPVGERTVINVARCEDPTPPPSWLELEAAVIYVRSRRDDLSTLLRAKAASTLIVAHAPPLTPGSRPAHIVVASKTDLDADTLQTPEKLGSVISGGLARWTVITAGAAGARAYGAGATLITPASSVQPVDTTGAGDAFAAGLIHALAKDQPMLEALNVAVGFGTEATLWPTSGLPAAAVHRLLQEM